MSNNYIIPCISSLLVIIVVYMDDIFLAKPSDKPMKKYTKYFIYTFVSFMLSMYFFNNYGLPITVQPNVFLGDPDF